MSEERAEYGVTVQQSSIAPVMTVKGIADRVNLVHQVMQSVMQVNTHYGTVPGCGNKMVLLKPGADVLAMTFKLSPSYEVTKDDLGGGHREYTVRCVMRASDGAVVADGVGSCSTMERKYRYRKGQGGQQVENTDIADVYNTVLKMAKKRAHIDATLTATGAADMFTQDLIDEESIAATPAQPAMKPETAKMLTALIDDTKADTAKILAFAKSATLESIPEVTAQKVIAMLEKKKAGAQ